MAGLAGNADWQPATDLAVSSTRRSAPARVGRTATVAFRVRNTGPLAARDVELRVSVTNGARARATVASGTCAALACQVASLPSGRTIAVSVRVRPVWAGRIAVSIRPTTATGEANAANDSARSGLAARR
jgi:Domain of unknown function DUF11